MTVLVAGWVAAFQFTEFVSQSSCLSHFHILKISHPQLDLLLMCWDINSALEAFPEVPVPTQQEIPKQGHRYPVHTGHLDGPECNPVPILMFFGGFSTIHSHVSLFLGFQFFILLSQKGARFFFKEGRHTYRTPPQGVCIGEKIIIGIFFHQVNQERGKDKDKEPNVPCCDQLLPESTREKQISATETKREERNLPNDPHHHH